MRECISIFNAKSSPSSVFTGVVFLMSILLFDATARAETKPKGPPIEEEVDDTPYTRYGEFNDEQAEADATRFFQYGRLFGLALGMGFEGATGNRGALWQGGFPCVDLKVQYWFDFNFALALGIQTTPHRFATVAPTNDRTSVTLTRLGIDLKYYFNTRDLSAPISFANPYVLVGFGTYTKAQASIQNAITDTDSHVGFAAGGGLEFVIAPRKTYFYFESKIHAATFKDTYTDALAGGGANPQLADLSGFFYTFTGGILFTW